MIKLGYNDQRKYANIFLRRTPLIRKNFLIIPDLQIPFEHERALEFALKVKKEFKTTATICIGDECDLYFASRFPKDPDADLTPFTELKLARERLKDWYKAFPTVDVCLSNHGLRWIARAQECQIPTDVLKPYRTLLAAPKTWRWYEEIRVKTKSPFRCVHGTGYAGPLGHRTAATDASMSTIIGHIHAHPGVSYINNGFSTYWAMNVGSLVNQNANVVAFKYAKYSRFKSVLSIGVVLNDGRLPLVIPYGSI